jgi:type I restriction enzyme S subunit
MFGDTVQNDKGWPKTTVGDVAEIKIGPFGTLLHNEDYVENGHALVNPSQIIDGKICVDPRLTITSAKYEVLSAYKLQIGDVVFGRRGEMGRCAVVYENGLLCGTGSMIIRSRQRIKPYLLQYILSSPTYKKIIEDKAVGVTMMNLNVPIVSGIQIPLLPIDLQEQFIAFMEQADKSKVAVLQLINHNHFTLI